MCWEEGQDVDGCLYEGENQVPASVKREGHAAAIYYAERLGS